MFIDTAHHHYRLRLEIDAFVGAAAVVPGLFSLFADKKKIRHFL